MPSMSYDVIERWIGDLDSLYYWAVDYCKQHKCSVKAFIKENYTDILKEIKKHG